MAGTINLSLQQQFDSQGLPLGGGKLYCFQSGTSTPQSAYKDIALTIPHQNPVELDASGRVPQMFFADGTIKLRLTNSGGSIVVFEADFLPILGASTGGTGGSSVDATTILATGDLKHRYGTGALSGFVRANGNTIGNAVSGASERANADCLALFQLLYANDPSLTVSGGRTGNSANDFAANKTITLPDMRGRTLAGMDDMGASGGTINRLNAVLGSTTLGSAGGGQLYAISIANLPAHTPAGTITLGGSPAGTLSINPPSGSVSTSVTVNANSTGLTAATHSGYLTDAGLVTMGSGGLSLHAGAGVTTSIDVTDPTHAHTATATSTFTGNALSGIFTGSALSSTCTATFTGTSIGTGATMTIAPPTMVVTIYIKL